MAAGVVTVLGEISRDHLECGICHERYQTPKILNCLHSFCEKCLLKYQKSLRDTTVIPCPVCRRESKIPSDGVSGLKTNFHLKEIVEDFALKEKLTQKGGVKILCELCEDQREAQSRCMDCPFLLCKQCQAVHQRISATANHEVLALDVLRTGVADLQKKRKAEPLCQKHQGEKKRFFCETCKELICRDCTVVEHRAHQFTTIDDAAPRLRQNVKTLIQELEHQMLHLQNSETEIREMDSELIRSASLAEQQVKKQASVEENKIEEHLRAVLEGISRRSDYRSQTLQENGIPLPASKFVLVPLPQDENPELAHDMFSTIDKILGFLNDRAEQLIKADQDVRTLIQQSINTAREDAKDGKSKVADSKERLLSQIKDILAEKESCLKVVSSKIERMRHALEIANDLVTSASDADFLSLQSIIDSDIRLLLEQSPPKIPTGYQTIAFKGTSDTMLGEVVVGATWTSASEIEPYYTKTTVHTRQADVETWDSQYFGHRYDLEIEYENYEVSEDTAATITSIAAFGEDEVLIGCGDHADAVVMYNTSGKRTREHKIKAYSGGWLVYRVASLRNGSFVAVLLGQQSQPSTCIAVFGTVPNTAIHVLGWDGTIRSAGSAPQNTVTSPISLQQGQYIAAASSFGKDQIVVGCQGSKYEVMVLECSNGYVIRRQAIQIKPDFLASMGEERVLIGARSPASVQGLKFKGDTFQSFLSIDPTVDCSPEENEKPNCLGLCSDGTDYIFVVLSVKSAQKRVHVHQYNRIGRFIRCSVLETEEPVTGTAVTGDGRLVFADQHKLRLFVMRQL